MTSNLIDEAAKVIAVPQILINIVSKRVRQLSHGHRPLVEHTPRMSYADIALKEIIEKKLDYRLSEKQGSEPGGR
jgi:DNA-directed RNA polymerase subunit omega